MRKKLFGISVSVILILVTVTPVIGSAQQMEILEIETSVNKSLLNLKSILDNEDQDSEQQSSDSYPTDIGNDGWTRYQKRMGWKYTLKQHLRQIYFAVILAPLVAIVITGGGVTAILAVWAVWEYIKSGGENPIDIILLLAAAASALIVVIERIKNQVFRQRIQDLFDAIENCKRWLEEDRDYENDMIIEGMIMAVGSQRLETITVSCRGVTSNYSAVFGVTSYQMTVPSYWGGEELHRSHTCLIEISSKSHNRVIKNSISDRWCYSDGILKNNFRFIW